MVKIKVTPAKTKSKTGRPPAPDPRDAVFSIRIKRSVYETLRAGAEADGRSMASFAERILIEGLKAKGLMK
jgi:hypothetical protein